MNTGYLVGEIMSSEVVSASPETKIIEAAKIMADKKIGSVVVVIFSKVAGIITEQDLTRKVLAKGIDAKEKTIEEIMSKNIQTIEPEKDIYEAVSLMGNNEIKHLPVVSDGKLVGIITAKDIIKIEPGLIDLLNFKSSENSRRLKDEKDSNKDEDFAKEEGLMFDEEMENGA